MCIYICIHNNSNTDDTAADADDLRARELYHCRAMAIIIIYIYY